MSEKSVPEHSHNSKGVKGTYRVGTNALGWINYNKNPTPWQQAVASNTNILRTQPIFDTCLRRVPANFYLPGNDRRRAILAQRAKTESGKERCNNE